MRKLDHTNAEELYEILTNPDLNQDRMQHSGSGCYRDAFLFTSDIDGGEYILKVPCLDETEPRDKEENLKHAREEFAKYQRAERTGIKDILIPIISFYDEEGATVVPLAHVDEASCGSAYIYEGIEAYDEISAKIEDSEGGIALEILAELGFEFEEAIEMALDFQSKIDRSVEYLHDLHNGNIGFYNDRIVVIDYGFE